MGSGFSRLFLRLIGNYYRGEDGRAAKWLTAGVLLATLLQVVS